MWGESSYGYKRYGIKNYTFMVVSQFDVEALGLEQVRSKFSAVLFRNIETIASNSVNT